MWQHIIAFVKALVGSIMKHNTGVLAAVIAYFGFSSMIPLVLLLIFAASHVIPNTYVNDFLSKFVASYIPTVPKAHQLLMDNLSRLEDLGARVSVFTVLGLFWTTVGGFVSFQYILDLIWGIRKRRSFIHQYLVGFSTLVFLMALTTSSALITAVTPHLLSVVGSKLHIPPWVFAAHLTGQIAFPVFLLLTCYYCYRFLPSRALSQGLLWFGAILATAGIYVSHLGFVWYTGHLGRYQVIYGTLTFIMLLLFWVYIVSMIVLISGEIIVTLNARKTIDRQNFNQ